MTGIHYQALDSRLHGWDPRFKLATLGLISFTLLRTSAWGLTAFSLLLLIGFISARCDLRPLVGNLKLVGWFLVIVVGLRAVSTPGEIFFQWGWLAITREGVALGILVSARLLLLILLSLLLIVTTRPAEVRAAVEWYLRPVPWVPERRVGMMIGLLVRFIPVILEQARQTIAAQRARCIENRKNPVFRLSRMSIPVIVRTFTCADRLVLAMVARGYSDDRTGPQLTASVRDVKLFCALVLFVVLTQIWTG